jgi:peroxin-16
MAKIGGFGIRPGKELVSVETPDQEDLRILDKYLGNNKKVLKTISDKELQELLLTAGTRQLADQFGKHKYIHGRPRSPPGFWRTDMPSTQEAERDRQEARKVERDKVMERYTEAMTPGGLWKFADEY